MTKFAAAIEANIRLKSEYSPPMIGEYLANKLQNSEIRPMGDADSVTKPSARWPLVYFNYWL